MAESIVKSIAGIVIFGAALLVAARLLQRRGEPVSLMGFLMRVAGWTLIASAAVTILASTLQVAGSILLWMCSFAVLMMVANRVGRARRDMVLNVIATTVEKRMPLERVLRALATETRGQTRARLVALVGLLERGVDLPEALVKTPRLVPQEAVAAARIGRETGQMGRALREAAQQRTQAAPLWAPLTSRILWLFWSSLLLVNVTGGFVRFLLPKFELIFADFGIEMPLIAQRMIDWSGNVWIQMTISQVLVICALVFLYSVVAYIGWAPWPATLLTLGTGGSRGVLLRQLALAAESQRPLPICLETVAATRPPWARRRLRAAAQSLAAGSPLGDSLARHRLFSLRDGQLLMAAERAGNLPWALRALADSSERRMGYRLQSLGQVLVPLVVVLFGVLVAIIALACYLPLIKLIESLVP
ncbi:MAG: type II secretion system F family protein [Pirellulales bacterium]|nr:type II secretion system F family protein [Pirellulales bacterium]